MAADISSNHIIQWFVRCAADLDAARSELSRLDGAVGDGDHGSTMAEGMEAAARAIETRKADAVSDLLDAAGKAFLGRVGATVGPLYAAAFVSAGLAVKTSPTIPTLLDAISTAIRVRGEAKPGDCTMVDSWHAAAQAARQAAQSGASAPAQTDAAHRAAVEGAERTRALVARRGRAQRLGDRSIGHMDPGACSAAIIVEALRDVMDKAQ